MRKQLRSLGLGSLVKILDIGSASFATLDFNAQSLIRGRLNLAAAAPASPWAEEVIL